MKFLQLCIAGTLALPLHLQARTSEPPTPPISGPTMDQTIAFMNDTFTKMGQIWYEVLIAPSDSNQKYLGPSGSKNTAMTVHKQSVILTESSTLTYAVVATKEFKDREVMKNGKLLLDFKTDKNLNLLNGAKYVDIDTKEEINTPTSISLESVDPRTVSVERITMRGFHQWDSTWADDPTDVYTLKAMLPYPNKGTAVTVGYFNDKDLADHAAKAFIHAIVLCHKPEAPSLF
jgi:hypothetical protein